MSEDQERELDPDEVECPVVTCRADVGEPCRSPSGVKSRTVHLPRRRAAAAGQIHRRAPRAQRGSTNPGASSLTSEARSRGGKRTAQERARRRKEAEAAVEAARAQAAEDAIREEAEALAADTFRYTRDRLIVRRQTLDAVQLAGLRLTEALEHMRRPRGFDDQGNPTTVSVEQYHVVKGVKKRTLDDDGTPSVKDELDVVGWYPPGMIESLAKVAATTLNSLRLEEGKPTGILEKQGDSGPSRTEQLLGETGVAELIAYAAQNLNQDQDGAS